MWKSIFQELYQNISPNASDLHESVILGIHSFNVSKGYKCTGLQEDDPQSEVILPELWNSNFHLYSFRYSYKQNANLYLKLVRLTDSKMTIHAVRSDQEDKIRTFSLNLDEIRKLRDEGKALGQVIIDNVIPVYLNEILNKLADEPKKTELREPVQRHYGIPANPMPNSNPYGGNPYPGFIPDNPYGPGVPLIMPDPGGNMVGPQHPIFGQQPRPGVRWDPVNPFNNPENPDHFPPPGGFPPHGFL